MDNKKTLVYNFIEFLRASEADGTVRADDREGIDVAIDALAEAFKIDTDADSGLSLRPTTLLSLVEAHTSAGPKETKTVSDEDKARAEKLKVAGNQSVAAKEYEKAIGEYTEAIEIDGSNPVYWSNRAAAQSQLGKNEAAVDDAKQALALDPSFSRAYSRLGHAYFAMGDFAASVDAYEQGLALEPGSAVMKSSLETAKKKLDASSVAKAAPSSAPSASGGGGGAPGMPDLSSMMNNPEIMGMAEKLMSGGGLDNIMKSPMFKNMMDKVQSGDMPDMSQLMSDPAMRKMAEDFGKGFK